MPVALVTGATRGLGREIARGLAACGMTVLAGCRDLQAGRRMAGEPTEAGTLVAVPIDVTDERTIQTLAKWIGEEFGHLDALVNNAAINIGSAVPSEVTAQEVRTVFDTNVAGVVATTHFMLPLLRRAESASVVNVSSQMGSLNLASSPGNPYHSLLAYHSSKAALNMLTVHYARELAEIGIKVNAVCPGRCATAINDFTGTRSPAEGARIAIRFATLGPDGPTGGFFNDGGRIAW